MRRTGPGRFAHFRGAIAPKGSNCSEREHGPLVERASGLEELRRGARGGVSPLLAGGYPHQRRHSLKPHPTLCLIPPLQQSKTKQKGGHVIADPNESPGSGSGRAAGGAPARASRAPESRPARARRPRQAEPRPRPDDGRGAAPRGRGPQPRRPLEAWRDHAAATAGAARCRRPAPGQGSTARATGPATPPWPASLRLRLRGFAASDPGDLDSRKAGSSPGRRRTAAVRSRKLCSAR